MDHARSETSKNHEMPTTGAFSWNTNDCSSSFQSVSSVETLESYEGNCSVVEPPNVIVVPYISVDNVISEEVITHIVSTNSKEYNCPNDNQMRQVYSTSGCPNIKECSIRIDQLEMNSFQSKNYLQPTNIRGHNEGVSESTLNSFAVCNINKVIAQEEGNAPLQSSEQIPTYYSDEESEFEGFDEKSINLVTKSNVDSHTDVHVEVHVEPSRPTVATKKPEIILVNSIVDLSDKHPEPIVPQQTLDNSESVAIDDDKTSPIGRKDQIVKPTINSHLPLIESDTSKPAVNSNQHVVESETRKPTVNTNQPVVESDNGSDTSDSGDKVKSAKPTDATDANKKLTENHDSKTKRKQSLEQIEARKMEKMRRKKEYQEIAQKIRQWRDAMARRQLKKARKNKIENKMSNRNENCHYLYRCQRKRKRISHSSDSSDSSDTSDSSNTSNSSDSSSDSDTDTTHRSYTSDTDKYKSYTSDTSQTSHRTDSDTSDSDSSDRSTTTEERYHRISLSATSNTSSDTSDTSDDDKFNRKRKLFRRKEIRRKPSNMKSTDNSFRFKLKKSERQRPIETDRKRKKFVSPSKRLVNNKNKVQKSVRGINNNIRKKCFTKRLDSRSRPSLIRLRKSDITKRQQVEPTSAGNFIVTQFSSNDYDESKRYFI